MVGKKVISKKVPFLAILGVFGLFLDTFRAVETRSEFSPKIAWSLSNNYGNKAECKKSENFDGPFN